MKRILDLPLPLWDGTNLTTQKKTLLTLPSLDAHNLSTLHTHSIPRCTDFISKAGYWFGISDAADYKGSIGYVVGRVPWMGAKTEHVVVEHKQKDEVIKQMSDENIAVYRTLRLMATRMAGQDERIQRLRSEKEEAMDVNKRVGGVPCGDRETRGED